MSGGHGQRETGKRPRESRGGAVAHPNDSSVLFICPFCHSTTTLQDHRRPRVPTKGTKTNPLASLAPLADPLASRGRP